ncbi:MAG: hypothetical protein AB7F19_02125 [Candidatus Babeliales bacterium]
MQVIFISTLSLFLIVPYTVCAQISEQLQNLSRSLYSLEQHLKTSGQARAQHFFDSPQKSIVWGQEIVQLPVLNQFAGPEYGGGASCGYQALKNAIFIPRIIFGKAALADLTSLSLAQELFSKQNPLGRWRVLVLQSMYRRVIKWVVDERLLQLLYDPRDKENLPSLPRAAQQLNQGLQDRFREKMRGFYQSVLTNKFSPDLMQKIMTEIQANTMQAPSDFPEHDRFYKKPVTKRELIDAIKNSKQTISGDIEGLEHFNFNEYVRSDEAIAQYLPRLKDTIEFGTHVPVDNKPVKYKGIAQISAALSYNISNVMNQVDYYGDWIKENQIQQIIDVEQKAGGLLYAMPVTFDGITIIENVPLLDDPRGFGENEKIREIADRYARADTFVHGFVVGLMAGIPGYPQGEEHWISLVLNKQQGKTQYIITDSGGNADRLNNPIIATLIKHLEGKA